MMTARPGGAGGSGGGGRPRRGRGGGRGAPRAGRGAGQAAPGLAALVPVRRALAPRLSGRGHAGHVALTFDDGPDPESTPRFLQVLADRQGRATFFLLRSLVARAPGVGRELAAPGHETGGHGWDHRYLPLRGPLATRDDLRRAADIIGRAAGTAPRLYRPPYGGLSTRGVPAAR